MIEAKTHAVEYGACNCGKDATEYIERYTEDGSYRLSWGIFCDACAKAEYAELARLDAAELAYDRDQAEYDAQYDAERAERDAEEYRAEVSAAFAEIAARQPIPAYWSGLDTRGEF